MNVRNCTIPPWYFPVSTLCEPPSSHTEIRWCNLTQFTLQGDPVFASMIDMFGSEADVRPEVALAVGTVPGLGICPERHASHSWGISKGKSTSPSAQPIPPLWDRYKGPRTGFREISWMSHSMTPEPTPSPPGFCSLNAGRIEVV